MSTPPRLPDPEPTPVTTLTRDPRTLLDPVEYAGVVKTILDNNPGMQRALAERIADESIRFVVAAASSPLPIAPSRVVDEGWHALILHTALYQRLCQQLGRFVHHQPGWDPTHYDPLILERTQEQIQAAGYGSDPELWAGPDDDGIPVAAKCQHAPECQVRPMPKPEWPSA